MKNSLNKNLLGQKYEVLSNKRIATDTALIEFRGNISFKPGQFVEAGLDHFGSVPLAPCSSPKNKKTFEFCVKASGSTTKKMTELLPGDFIDIRGPYGNHWQFENFIKTDFIIITGGLGLVPLRPLLLEIEQKRLLLTKVKLIAGFRSPDHALFADDLERWRKKFNVEVVVDFSHEKFSGNIGSVVDELEKVKIDSDLTVALMCGPEVMYQPCLDILEQKNILPKHIFLSLERRMECGIGLCQHCSCGSSLVCQDGPIFRYDKIKNELNK